MSQLQQLWESLTVRQRISLGLAILLAGAGLYGFTRWNHAQGFRPLFQELSQEDAGAILTRLRERGVEFQLRDGGASIYVPEAQVDELRIELAGAGLPRSGRVGLELFDKPNFGASEYGEKINYHRALEGELERSVMALAEVQSARVHVTLPKDSVFVESRQPAKASVMVRLRPGSQLSRQNVLAICHLIASAVPGLKPNAVSVLDVRGNLLSHGAQGAEETDAPDAALEFRRKLEQDLLHKITTTLEPLLGPGRFRAGVSAECDFTTGEESEESYDPNRTVLTSSQKTEEGSGQPEPAGVPGTASNLPRPAPRGSLQGAGFLRKTEAVNYLPSKTVRRVHYPKGTLKRLSVALLVDHTVRFSGTGEKAQKIVEAPSPARLKSIRDLVAGAVGLVEKRGDQLVVETLPFESTLALEPIPERPPAAAAPGPPGWVPAWLRPLWTAGLVPVIVGGAAVLSLAMVAAVWARIRKRRDKRSMTAEPAKAIAAEPQSSQLAAPHQDPAKRAQDLLAEQLALREKQAEEAVQSLRVAQLATPRSEVLVRHLSAEAKRDPEGVSRLVRVWLNEGER